MEAIFGVTVSPDGKVIATDGNVIHLWDAATGKLRGTVKSVKDTREGMSLVAVIEFISPANKDRPAPDAREKLVSKTLTYLDLGIGVALVDIVTNRLANLHNELVAALRVRAAARLPDVPTYVAGYRPTREDGRWIIDMWPYSAAVGSVVPTVPLALKNGPLVPLDLEGTYCAALADHNL